MIAVSSDTQEISKQARKETYERVLAIVEKNTGGEQQALVSDFVVRQIATQAGMYGPQVIKAICAAATNGDLLRWQGKLARTDEESLLAIIEDEVEKDHPRHLLIAECNKRLDSIRNGGDE